MTQDAPQRCLACSIFQKEIERLQASGRLDVSVDYLPSMLHMVPERLEQRLKAALAGRQGEGGGTFLAFGDCCARMHEFEEEPATGRTAGINCCEIVLGHEAYHKLRLEGAFFLMPEWTLNWKTVFQSQLGLLGDNAKDFMREMHSRLIYLDTGIIPIPYKNLEEASSYLGLPMEILPVSLEPLLASLQEAARSARTHGQP